MTIIDDNDVVVIRGQPESQMMKSIKENGVSVNLRFWTTPQEVFRYKLSNYSTP